MLREIGELGDISVVDEPQENDSQLPSASIYYSTPSTSNRIIVTKISSQIPGLMNYFDIGEGKGQSWHSFLQEQASDELSLASELEAWDILSDEALANFEATLD